MMRHRYLALFNGLAVDPERVKNHSIELRAMPREMTVNGDNEEGLVEHLNTGRRQFSDFLSSAMQTLDID